MGDWLIWVLLAVLVLAVVGAVWAFVSSQEKGRARATAGHLREQAAGSEQYAEGREAAARRAQEEAEAAKERAALAAQEAQEAEERAREATQEARDHRDRVTDTYLEADEIDPDVRD